MDEKQLTGNIPLAINLESCNVLNLFNKFEYKMTFTMTNPITIRLPFPPSVNTYWRVGQLKGMKHPMHMISKKGREYSTAVAKLILKHGLTYTYMEGQTLSVTIKLFPPDRRRRDIDNYTKGIFDSLSKCKFWHDDCQVKRLDIEMAEVVKEGCAELIVRLHSTT